MKCQAVSKTAVAGDAQQIGGLLLMSSFLAKFCFSLLYAALGAFFGALGTLLLVLAISLVSGGNFLPPVFAMGATVAGAAGVAILAVRGYLVSDAAERSDEERRSAQGIRPGSDRE